MIEPIAFDVPNYIDPRGTLAVVDFPYFKRIFWVRDSSGIRGHHLHLSCWQLLIPIIGTFLIILSKDGIGKREHTLSGGTPAGVLVPPGWCISYIPITEVPTVILVLATESYDEDIIIPCREDIYDADN